MSALVSWGVSAYAFHSDSAYNTRHQYFLASCETCILCHLRHFNIHSMQSQIYIACTQLLQQSQPWRQQHPSWISFCQS